VTVQCCVVKPAAFFSGAVQDGMAAESPSLAIRGSRPRHCLCQAHPLRPEAAQRISRS
jgi:hypothetical protein